MSDPLDALIDKHLPAKTAGADPLDALIDKHLSAYRSPLDSPAGYGPGWLQSVAGHAADNIPFSRQIAAALQAAKMQADGSPFDFGENYKQLLTNQEAQLARSKATDPGLSRLGSGLGFVGTAAALPGRGLAQLAGLGGVLGLADATTNPDATRGQVARQTALSAVAAPVLGKAVEVAAPFLGKTLGGAADYLGGKAQDLAGWLKVNSIHPTPVLGEAMEALPGGKAAIGRELLERGVGGLTKGSTAAQAEKALGAAGREVDAIAASHDADGGPPVDLRAPLNAGLEEAARLQAQPFSAAKAAGKRLEDIVYSYADKFPEGKAPAADALAVKRELQGEAFGAGEMLKKSGDQLSGHYAQGVAKLAGAVDDSMDSALGPQFEAANLTFRRLLGASNAADRQAARASANHLLGLMPAVIGSGELAAGHGLEKAAPTAIAMALLNKYGSQAGARVMYTPVGGGLNLAGRGLQSLPAAFAGRLAAERAPTLADMVHAPLDLPAIAGNERPRRQMTLAGLLQGGQ